MKKPKIDKMIILHKRGCIFGTPEHRGVKNPWCFDRFILRYVEKMALKSCKTQGLRTNIANRLDEIHIPNPTAYGKQPAFRLRLNAIYDKHSKPSLRNAQEK